MSISLRLVAVSLILSTSIGGCSGSRVPLSNDQSAFAGRWTAADGTYLHIYLDGAADVKNSQQEIKNANVALDKSRIKIDRGWQKQTYQITQLPQKQADKWIMSLNNIIYVKGIDPKEQPIVAVLPPHSFQSEATFAGRVERTLQQSFQEKTKIPIHGVTCPIAVESRIGNEFGCRLVATDSTSLEVSVTQTDADGNINWNPKQGLLSLDTLEKGIQLNLQQKTGQGTQVSCGGKPFKIAKEGDKFLCESVFPDGKKKQVEISVIDANGNVKWEIYE